LKELISSTLGKINDPKNGKEFFYSKVNQPIFLPQEIYNCITDIKAKISEQNYGTHLWPSQVWYIDFTEKSKGNFKVRYRTKLMISKLAPVFHLQHEFDIDNLDDDTTSPTLDGFGGQPYTKDQIRLHELTKYKLEESGYIELLLREMDEVILGLTFKDGITIFGPQVTVEHAIFRDLNEFTR
jgi:hypothetical protein